MKISVSTNIDIADVYELCVPINKRLCTARIRQIAHFQFHQRAFDPDGGWVYPSDYFLAQSLIEEGLATQTP